MNETESTEDSLLSLRVWLALFSSVKSIEAVIRRNLRETFASTLPRFDLLSQLYRTSDSLTMGELSARLMVSNGNVTGLIKRLVAEGLVESIADSEDKRIQRVSLTRKGRRCFGVMAPTNQTWVKETMAGLTASDLRELQRLLTKLKASVSAAEHGSEEPLAPTD